MVRFGVLLNNTSVMTRTRTQSADQKHQSFLSAHQRHATRLHKRWPFINKTQRDFFLTLNQVILERCSSQADTSERLDGVQGFRDCSGIVLQHVTLVTNHNVRTLGLEKGLLLLLSIIYTGQPRQCKNTVLPDGGPIEKAIHRTRISARRGTRSHLIEKVECLI